MMWIINTIINKSLTKLNIGENIKFGRKLHGFSQSDLSNKLKVSSNSVSNWERGTAEPTLTALIKLSRLFKVLIDDLLTKDLEAEGFEVGSPFQLAIVTLNNHNVLVPAEDFKDYCGWNDAHQNPLFPICPPYFCWQCGHLGGSDGNFKWRDNW